MAKITQKQSFETGKAGSSGESGKTGTCPMCADPTVHAFRPFCSRRCADLDLARWLKGNYAIPGPPAAPEDPVGEGNNGAGSDFDRDRFGDTEPDP